jgi:diguanylate cyclase (GGDEF)-like protein
MFFHIIIRGIVMSNTHDSPNNKNQLNQQISDQISSTQQTKQEFNDRERQDPVTGLLNQEQLLKQITSAIEVSAQNNNQFAIFFLDLDRFKLINNSLNHAAGNQVLQIAARRLQTAVSAEDTLARFGGDEFVIIYKNIDKNYEADIKKKTQQLMNLFKQPFNLENRKVTLSVSIGICLFSKDDATANILLRNAEVAMYRVKARGGNNFQLYTPDLSQESLNQLDREIELRQAITNNEFFLCYQPQFDIKNEKLIAVEALIRWRHPRKGVIAPMDFIPLAESTGLIIPISDWVMRTACQQNKRWQDQGIPPIRIAVNISGQQFKLSNLVEDVSNILKETQLKPEYLELELTENVLLNNREIILAVTELKKLGVIIAIDDFGTGYSSLSYLHELPLDRVKIDSSFIQRIQSPTDDEVIVRAVIAMANSLNL